MLGAFARFRFTFVPILLLFAAAGLDALAAAVSSWREQRWLWTCGPGLALATIAALVSSRPLPYLRQDAVTYVNLGMGLLADGKPAAAVEPLDKAIASRPAMAGAHLNLGHALLALHRDEEALASYERALEHAPDFGMAHAALGHYYARMRLYEQAQPHLSRAVELVPELPSLRVELADARMARGDAAGAVAELREALRRDPTCVDCAANLSWILATTSDSTVRDGREAVAVAEQLTARVLAPGNMPPPLVEVAMLDRLAAAYAASGRYGEAVDTIRRAIDVARGIDAPSALDELSSRLKLYEAGQPYRQ